MVRLIQGSHDLLGPPVGANSGVLVFESLMSREETVTPSDDKTTVVGGDRSDLRSLITLDESVELAAVLTDNNVSALGADHKAGVILHPSMANNAMSTLSVLELGTHII